MHFVHPCIAYFMSDIESIFNEDSDSDISEEFLNSIPEDSDSSDDENYIENLNESNVDASISILILKVGMNFLYRMLHSNI
ncbi:10050_t:CDS:2 [Funneliformis geosporum]|nr:10050_t:CDS:2 [Funneliformis geosporum]